MSSFLGFGQMSFMFMNGTNMTLLIWSLLPAAVRSQVTWMYWLWAVLPLATMVFVGSFLAIRWMFPPEPISLVSRRTLVSQLQVLGPLTHEERITGSVLIGVLAAFTTQPLHGIEPAWVALIGFMVLVATGIVDRDTLRRQIDWGTVLLLGALVGLSDLIRLTGLSDVIGQLVAPALTPFSGSPVLFLTACALVTLLVRFVVPAQQTALLMLLSLMPIAGRFGYSEFALAVTVLLIGGTWVVPQQQPQYVALYSSTDGKLFDHKQVLPLAFVQAAISVVALIAATPIWQWMGLLK